MQNQSMGRSRVAPMIRLRRARGSPKKSIGETVSPYYHALNSCYFAQIWVTVRMPAAAANSELPCPHFSAGERKLKYSGPGFGYNQESSVRMEPIYFFGFSPCLSASVVQRFLSLVVASATPSADAIAYTQTTCSTGAIPTPQSSAANTKDKPCSPTWQTLTPTQPHKPGNKI